MAVAMVLALARLQHAQNNLARPPTIVTVAPVLLQTIETSVASCIYPNLRGVAPIANGSDIPSRACLGRTNHKHSDCLRLCTQAHPSAHRRKKLHTPTRSRSLPTLSRPASLMDVEGRVVNK
jgi:hypothetical protein